MVYKSGVTCFDIDAVPEDEDMTDEFVANSTFKMNQNKNEFDQSHDELII
jgi:hypothetical protein